MATTINNVYLLTPAAKAAIKNEYLHDPELAHHNQVTRMLQGVTRTLAQRLYDAEPTITYYHDLMAEDKFLAYDMTPNSGLRALHLTLATARNLMLAGAMGALRRAHHGLETAHLRTHNLDAEPFTVERELEALQVVWNAIREARVMASTARDQVERVRKLYETAEDAPKHMLVVFDWLLGYLADWITDVNIVISREGRIAAMSAGIKAWERQRKTRWEDEMLLTKLVPVSW